MNLPGHAEDFYIRQPHLPLRLGAGGVVAHASADRVEIALVRELPLPGDAYVLPKGGIEPGESPEEAARREVHEEAGLAKVRLLSHLGDRERRAFEGDKWQSTRYFLFYAEETESRIIDVAHHYGFGWFPLENPPPLFWKDEWELLLSNAVLIRDLALRAAREAAC